MKSIKGAIAALITLSFCFGFGAFLLQLGLGIIDAGELTYQHSGRQVVVSPETHAFSYYYQVAFFGTSAGFLLFFGVSFLMYALAKIIRLARSEENAIAARIYDAATRVAWFSISLCAIWFVLKVCRGALIE